MVSELAGEGAMPPQLPTPARRFLKIAELRDRFQQQIRSGSKLRRGVIKRKVFRYFNPSVGAFQSVIHHRRFRFFPSIASSSLWNRSARCSSKVLVNRTSWSKSVKRSSVVLVNSLSVCVGRSPAIPIQFLSKVLITSLWSRSAKISSAELIVAASLPQWRMRKKKQLCTILFVACISWSRSVESMSAELINRSSMAIVVPSPFVLEQWRSWSRSMKNSSRVLVNPMFIAFDCRSWSRSVEIDDNSSEEIEDKAENLDDDDGEELTAVNKIRCRRFDFDDEEEQEEQKDEIDVDQPEDSEKTSFNSSVQQHISQQPWFSRQNSGGSGQVGDSEIVFEMQQISETVATVLGMQHAKLQSSFVLIGLITEKESFNAATTWFFVPKKACVHEVAVQFLVSLHTYAGKRAIVDKLVRKVAAKTNGLAGDGTTTSVVLAQGLSDEGVKIVAAVALYLRKVGAEIVKRALSYPLKLIAKTAGVNESVVSEKVFSSDNSKYEYNASAAKVVGSGCMLTLKPICWITFQVCIASWCSECIFLMLELKSEKEKAEIRLYDPSQKGFTAEEAYYLTFIVSWAYKLACSSLRGGVGGRYEHASREE